MSAYSNTEFFHQAFRGGHRGKCRNEPAVSDGALNDIIRVGPIDEELWIVEDFSDTLTVAGIVVLITRDSKAVQASIFIILEVKLDVSVTLGLVIAVAGDVSKTDLNLRFLAR